MERQNAAALEAEVDSLEKQQSELTAKLEERETYDNPSLAVQLNRQLAGVAQSLARATAKWEKEASAQGVAL